MDPPDSRSCRRGLYARRVLLPRRRARLRPTNWLPKISMGLTLAQLSSRPRCADCGGPLQSMKPWRQEAIIGECLGRRGQDGRGFGTVMADGHMACLCIRGSRCLVICSSVSRDDEACQRFLEGLESRGHLFTWAHDHLTFPPHLNFTINVANMASLRAALGRALRAHREERFRRYARRRMDRG